jgi:hypothetical protein
LACWMDGWTVVLCRSKSDLSCGRYDDYSHSIFIYYTIIIRK